MYDGMKMVFVVLMLLSKPWHRQHCLVVFPLTYFVNEKKVSPKYQPIFELCYRLYSKEIFLPVATNLSRKKHS